MTPRFSRWILAVPILAAGCAAPPPDRQLFATASALTKLSSSVEATVLFRNPPPTATDRELLRLSTADNPELLRAFEPFSVRVLKHAQGVVVLVCDREGRTALLEDASCTARLDRHHWRDAAGAACDFTLKMPEVCTP